MKSSGSRALPVGRRVLPVGLFLAAIAAACSSPGAATPVSWIRLVCHGPSITYEGIVEDGCSAPVQIE